jgi:hypothetical protein
MPSRYNYYIGARIVPEPSYRIYWWEIILWAGANVKLFDDIWNSITSSFTSNTDTSSQDPHEFASVDIGSSDIHDDRGSSFNDPTPFNGFGTSACDIQCAAESSSCTAGSITNETWGSTGSSFGSGIGSEW